MKERGDGVSGPGTASAAARNDPHCLNTELSGAGVCAGYLVVGGFIIARDWEVSIRRRC